MKKKRLPGSVTVYLALILILAASLILTLTESARVSAMKSALRSITYMAEDSVFSQYIRPIFSDYGVMGLWKSEEEFLDDFSQYASFNLDSSDLLYVANADLYNMKYVSAEIVNVKRITDENGKIFSDQVYEYMKYYLTESVAGELISGLDIFSDSRVVSEFSEKVEEYSDVFTDVETAVSDIREKTEEVKSISQTPKELLDELLGETESYGEFTQTLEQLKSTKTEIEEGLSQIKEKTDEYYARIEEAKKAAEELENILEGDYSDISDQVYESLEEQLKELEEKSTDVQADYYKAAQNGELVQNYLDKVRGLDGLFSDLSDGINEENANEYKTLVEQYAQEFSDFDLSALGVDFDTAAVESEDGSFLDAISDLFNAGIMGYVKEDISEKSIKTEGLPSVGEYSDGDEEEENVAVKKMFMCEYVRTHFSNAVNAEDDNALDYEVEYILGGKESDLKNLEYVVNRIVLIRTGCNMISILSDAQKTGEAELLATALAGFTGMPVLIKIVQMLILTGWSLAESYTDVKALLAGEKVPTIKGSNEWNISIEGLKNFSGDSITTNASEHGLEYEDYLRVLLAFEKDETMYYRTMDCIQLDICLKENADFRMTQCITEITVSASYSADRLFTSIPFVKNTIHAYGGDYYFSIEQSAGYW